MSLTESWWWWANSLVPRSMGRASLDDVLDASSVPVAPRRRRRGARTGGTVMRFNILDERPRVINERAQIPQGPIPSSVIPTTVATASTSSVYVYRDPLSLKEGFEDIIRNIRNAIEYANAEDFRIAMTWLRRYRFEYGGATRPSPANNSVIQTLVRCRAKSPLPREKQNEMLQELLDAAVDDPDSLVFRPETMKTRALLDPDLLAIEDDLRKKAFRDEKQFFVGGRKVAALKFRFPAVFVAMYYGASEMVSSLLVMPPHLQRPVRADRGKFPDYVVSQLNPVEPMFIDNTSMIEYALARRKYGSAYILARYRVLTKPMRLPGTHMSLCMLVAKTMLEDRRLAHAVGGVDPQRIAELGGYINTFARQPSELKRDLGILPQDAEYLWNAIALAQHCFEQQNFDYPIGVSPADTVVRTRIHDDYDPEDPACNICGLLYEIMAPRFRWRVR